VDHFIPGIAADHATQGSTAHLGLTYYFYPVSNCSQQTCKLSVGFVSSQDGGLTWTAGQQLAGNMNTGWLPQTSLGQMVGDYISTSYVNGKAFGVFARAAQNNGSKLNESMFAPSTGFIQESNGPFFSSAADKPVPNAKSDHEPRKFMDSDGRIPIPPAKNTHPTMK
jgi:hypothetical protein